MIVNRLEWLMERQTLLTLNPLSISCRVLQTKQNRGWCLPSKNILRVSLVFHFYWSKDAFRCWIVSCTAEIYSAINRYPFSIRHGSAEVYGHGIRFGYPGAFQARWALTPATRIMTKQSGNKEFVYYYPAHHPRQNWHFFEGKYLRLKV